MNISKGIAMAFSLGLIATLGSVALAGGVGDSRVELIGFPAESLGAGNLTFTDDGELWLLHQWPAQDSVIYRYQDGEWVLIRREILTPLPGIMPAGISSDGSVMVLTDAYRTEVVEGPAVSTLPRMWTYTVLDGGHAHEEYVFGSVSGGAISGNGQVVTLSGRESGRYKTDSLVWMGSSELINISDGLPREEASYGAGLPSEDGSVIVFGTGLNDSTGESRIWVWEDGERTEIPRLDPMGEDFHELRAISADGRAVFGTDGGPDRGGLSYWAGPLVDPDDWSAQPMQNAATAWVWTQQSGTVPIIDRDRFLETSAMDINADGSVMLGFARPMRTNHWKQFLWFGDWFGDNEFVMVDDLFYSLGISIEADWYGFNAISGDGSKLTGYASIEGRYYAIIVTIPVRKP